MRACVSETEKERERERRTLKRRGKRTGIEQDAKGETKKYSLKNKTIIR